MKKLVLSLAVVFAVGMVSCGGNKEKECEDTTPATEVVEEAAVVEETPADSVVADSAAPAETPAETPAN